MEVKTSVGLYSYPGLVVEVVGSVVELDAGQGHERFQVTVETIDGLPMDLAGNELHDRDLERIQEALEDEHQRRAQALQSLPRSTERQVDQVLRTLEEAMAVRDFGEVERHLCEAKRKLSELRSQASRILAEGAAL